MNEEALQRCEEDRERAKTGPDQNLHEVAGLTYWGKDEDGDDEWVGTKEQWRRFEELLAEQELK